MTMAFPDPPSLAACKAGNNRDCAASDFTRSTTPEHWELFGSESTITGFINLLLEFGYLGGLAVLLFLAWAWTRFWVTQGKSASATGFAGPVLIIIAYTFCRADLYNVALFIWPMMFVLIFHWTIRRMFSKDAGPNRGSLRQPIAPQQR